MPSLERSLSGDVLVVDLEDGPVGTRPAPSRGRSGRTLVKCGALRVTRVTIAPGGGVPEHHTDGPIAVQPLVGQIRLTAAGKAYDIGPGQLLSVDAGVRHAVTSAGGATFLVTVAKLARARSR